MRKDKKVHNRWMKQYMQDYRAEIKAGLRIPVPKKKKGKR